MKQIILAACCLLVSMARPCGQVRSLDSFYKPGTKWATVTTYNFAMYPTTTYGASLAEVGGDSTISAYTYHLVHYTMDDPKIRIGAVRVDSQKVYFLNLGADTVYVQWPHVAAANSAASTLLPGTEYLLYDYNLRVGDSIFGQPVQKIDSVQAGGIYLRRFVFKEYPNSAINDYWIEGIGSNLGFLGSYSSAYPAYLGASVFPRTYHYCAPSMFYEFSEIVDGGHFFSTGSCDRNVLSAPQITGIKPGVRIFPNPASEDLVHIDVTGPAAAAEVHITNMLGQEVYRYSSYAGERSMEIRPELSAGMYILQVALADGSVFKQRFLRQ